MNQICNDNERLICRRNEYFEAEYFTAEFLLGVVRRRRADHSAVRQDQQGRHQSEVQRARLERRARVGDIRRLQPSGSASPGRHHLHVASLLTRLHQLGEIRPRAACASVRRREV